MKYEEEHVTAEHNKSMDPGAEDMICQCCRSLLPTLKPEYRVLIEEMELGNRDPEVMAQHLDITRTI